MNHVRALLLCITCLLLGATGAVLGQAGWSPITSPTGSELVQLFLNTSAYQNYATVNQLRNSTGYLLSAATSGTVVTTLSTDNLILTGAVGTLTVDVPPSPEDGQLFAINNGTTSNFSGTITVASTDSSTFLPTSPTITNLAQQTSQEWQYTAASKIWYRLR